jgi:hypothetical protein
MLRTRAADTKATSTAGAGSPRPAVAQPCQATSTPAAHAPSSTAAVCQCGGNRTATRLPGPRRQPSVSSAAVAAVQAPSSAAVSAVRSPMASS